MKMVIKGKVTAGLGLDKNSAMPQPWKGRALELATPTYRGGKVPASMTGESPVGAGGHHGPKKGAL